MRFSDEAGSGEAMRHLVLLLEWLSLSSKEPAIRFLILRPSANSALDSRVQRVPSEGLSHSRLCRPVTFTSPPLRLVPAATRAPAHLLGQAEY